jgi:hypothetical protein
MRFPALACALLWAGAAHAANISIESANPDKSALVVVQGNFDTNDGEQFFTKTSSLAAAVVRLQSGEGMIIHNLTDAEFVTWHFSPVKVGKETAELKDSC